MSFKCFFGFHNYSMVDWNISRYTRMMNGIQIGKIYEGAISLKCAICGKNEYYVCEDTGLSATLVKLNRQITNSASETIDLNTKIEFEN